MGSSCSTNVQNHTLGDTPRSQPRRSRRRLSTQSIYRNGSVSASSLDLVYATDTDQEPRRRALETRVNLRNGTTFAPSGGLVYTNARRQEPRRPLRTLPPTQDLLRNGTTFMSPEELVYTTGRHQLYGQRPNHSDQLYERLMTHDAAGYLPLHWACYRGRVSEILELLAMCPQAAQVSTTGMAKHTALSLVCGCPRDSDGTTELIHALVSLYPRATTIRDQSGMFPIDYYFRHQTPHNNVVLKLLISADVWRPGAARTRFRLQHLRNVFLTPDAQGNLPLHEACRGEDPGQAFYLLHRCPEAAMILTTHERRSALSLACDRPGPQPELIQWLVSIYPEAITISSIDDMLPLHYARNHHANQDILSYVDANVGRQEAPFRYQLLTLEATNGGISSEGIPVDRGKRESNRLSVLQLFDTCDEKVQTSGSIPEESVRECCICLEPLDRNISRSELCGHEFHTHCIQQQISSPCSNCPLCRAHVSLDTLTTIR